MISVLVATALGYALGTLTAGYYVVRLRSGEDLRRRGSGTVGATNVGRTLGRGAAVVVALLDLLKGALAVLLGGWIAGPAGAVAALVAAVAGHIWPVQLGFRGGKGVATAFGGVLVLAPAVAGLALAVFAVLFAATRRYRISGVGGVAVAPVAGLIVAVESLALVGITAVVGLVLLVQWTRRNPSAEVVDPAR